MKLEMDVISREVVNPSSPTPQHLKDYKLSFLDQIRCPLLMPHVLFYPADQDNIISNNSQKSNHLKKSLSQALALFYPLAGRLVGNSYVNCNDEGVTFVVAQAKCKLLDAITDPIPEELNKFLPCDPDDARDLCLVVQATFFSCGGLALGLGISHKVADATSYFMFVNTWAAISRGDNNAITSPKLVSAILFPPKLDSGKYCAPAAEKMENIVTKRFVFSAPKIAKLRDMYTKDTSNEGLTRVTRIEALSAFIWTRFMVATGAKYDSSKVYALQMFVDIRTRVVPPLSECHFGNMVLPTTIVPSLENNEDRTYGMVKKIRDAIRNVDGDYVAKIHEQKEKESLATIITNGRVVPESEMAIFQISSLCRLPLYKADFGWGIPTWNGSAKLPDSNLVFFIDSLSKGSIEAWVNLKDEDMVRFKVDEELLEYVS